MASKEDLPRVTAFSRAFGAALWLVMQERGVSQAAAARAIEKKAGASWVSERVRGLRAVDTDLIAGVAIVAGVEPRTIVQETLREMRRQQPDGDEGGAIVTPIKPKPQPSAPSRTVPKRKVAKRSAEKAGASEFEEE